MLRMLSKTCMLWLIIFCFCIPVVSEPIKKPLKIVGLVAARNESFQIAHCLQALSLYADAIVYLDDASNDTTLNVVQSLVDTCKIERIIRKNVWSRDEPGDKNALLNAGREIGGTHFIVIDADEMFTSNCTNNDFLRTKILSLSPGDELLLNWVQLWRNVNKYRFDNSVWTWNYKNVVFCDDGKCSYSSDFIHTPRCPLNLKGNRYKIEGYEYGLLHFQFVNWRNLLIKQAWYRCLEHIRNPSLSIHAINSKYAPSKNEQGLGTRKCPTEWFSGYSHFFDASVYDKKEIWREKQVLQWFAEHGKSFFAELDIWDVDWGVGLS